MASSFKKSKRYLSDSDLETESDFPRFIIIESLQDIQLNQLSPFLIEKTISSRSNPKNVKKFRTVNLLVEVEIKKYTENQLKREKFHNFKCRAYPHAKLNTSKGVVRSKELSLATPEEIETALKKTRYKRIQKGHYLLKWWNHTDPYIQSDFWETTNTKRNQNWLHNRKDRAVYTSSPVVLQMSKIWTLQRDMLRMQVCCKCGECDPDHMENECKNIKCSNCHEEHPAFSRIYGI